MNRMNNFDTAYESKKEAILTPSDSPSHQGDVAPLAVHPGTQEVTQLIVASEVDYCGGDSHHSVERLRPSGIQKAHRSQLF